MTTFRATAPAFAKILDDPRIERLSRLVRRPIVLNAVLAAWFVGWILYQQPIFTFNDGYLYWLAASTWLAGGDPWSVATGPHADFHFSGLPPTVLAFVPLTPFDGRVIALALGVVSVFAAYVIVRSLRLPIAFLLFPPIVEGIGSANPHLLLMALLLTGMRARETRRDMAAVRSIVAGVVAAILKVYAIVPVIGDRRARTAVAIVVACLVTIAIAPSLWSSYLGRFGEIGARLRVEAAGGFEASGVLLLVVVPALAWLWWRRPREAGWLTVPAIWPASQFFYWTFALPALPVPLLALLAIRIPALAAIATLIYAVWTAVASGSRGEGEPTDSRLSGDAGHIQGARQPSNSA